MCFFQVGSSLLLIVIVSRAEWVDDLVSILDKIYDNPYYRHMHPDPTLAIANMEEPLQVKRIQHLCFMKLIGYCRLQQ